MNPKKQSLSGRREFITIVVIVSLLLLAGLVLSLLHPYRPSSTFWIPVLICVGGILLSAIMVIIDITWRNPSKPS